MAIVPFPRIYVGRIAMNLSHGLQGQTHACVAQKIKKEIKKKNKKQIKQEIKKNQNKNQKNQKPNLVQNQNQKSKKINWKNYCFLWL